MTIRTRPLYLKIKTGADTFLRHLPLLGKPLRRLLIKSKSMIKNSVYHSTIFEEMGFAYMGPVDGHDIKTLCENLKYAKKDRRPVLMHVCTVKGKGYEHAENDPKSFHGLSGFDILSGDINAGTDNFSEKFGDALCDLAAEDERIVAVSAAMKLGTGLGRFSYLYRNRFFDVGIAEEHAVTFCAGLAANGMVPVFAVYSSFLQRSYDQIIHDAALQKLKLILAVDRAGIVGEDGETHQGLFDVSFLSGIPNVTIYAPSFYEEQRAFLHKSIYQDSSVVAIRYPRGRAADFPTGFTPSCGDYDLWGNPNAKKLLVTYGRLFTNACTACAQHGDFAVLKLNKIKPVHPKALEIAMGYEAVCFYEEGMINGGIGEHFGHTLNKNGFIGLYKTVGIEDVFVEQGTVERLLEKYKLDAQSMAETMAALSEENGK